MADMDCEMGTCPLNFDRENSACAGCRHNKKKQSPVKAIRAAIKRCRQYDEDECIGVECIGRVGNPCIFDTGKKSLTALEPLNYSEYMPKEEK